MVVRPSSLLGTSNSLFLASMVDRKAKKLAAHQSNSAPKGSVNFAPA